MNSKGKLLIVLLSILQLMELCYGMDLAGMQKYNGAHKKQNGQQVGIAWVARAPDRGTVSSAFHAGPVNVPVRNTPPVLRGAPHVPAPGV